MLRRTMLAGLVSLTWAGACSSGGSKSSGGSTTGSGRRDVIDTLAATGQCETFVQLLREAGYVGKLRGAGPFTVWAPNDKALEELRTQATLKRMHKLPSGDGLRRLLDHHIVAALVPTSGLSRSNSPRALDGQVLNVQRRGQKVEIGGANVISANLTASNGYIHIIDRVMGSPSTYQ